MITSLRNQIIILPQESETVLVELRIDLETTPFDSTIDVDDLTLVHYDNLAGEAMTIPTLLNKVGLLKVEAESIAKKSEQIKKRYIANFKKDLRKILFYI